MMHRAGLGEGNLACLLFSGYVGLGQRWVVFYATCLMDKYMWGYFMWGYVSIYIYLQSCQNFEFFKIEGASRQEIL